MIILDLLLCTQPYVYHISYNHRDNTPMEHNVLHNLDGSKMEMRLPINTNNSGKTDLLKSIIQNVHWLGFQLAHSVTWACSPENVHTIQSTYLWVLNKRKIMKTCIYWKNGIAIFSLLLKQITWLINFTHFLVLR